MACTYNYETGKITLDFHLVKYGEICGLRGIKGKAGNQECHRCPLYGGSYNDMTNFDWESFVKCKHPNAQNSESSSFAMYDICEKFREEALKHFYD
jgi:hypothetical protein